MRSLFVVLMLILLIVGCSQGTPSEEQPKDNPKPELVVTGNYDGKYVYIIDPTYKDFGAGFYTQLQLQTSSSGYSGTLTHGQDTGFSPLTLDCGAIDSNSNLDCTSTHNGRTFEFTGKISGTTKYSGTFSDSVGLPYFNANLTMGTFEFKTNNFNDGEGTYPDDPEAKIVGVYKGTMEITIPIDGSSFSSQPAQLSITSSNGKYEAQFTEQTFGSSTLSCTESGATIICEGEYGANIIKFTGKITKTFYSGSIELRENNFITNTGKFEFVRQ